MMVPCPKLMVAIISPLNIEISKSKEIQVDGIYYFFCHASH